MNPYSIAHLFEVIQIEYHRWKKIFSLNSYTIDCMDNAVFYNSKSEFIAFVRVKYNFLYPFANVKELEIELSELNFF